MYNSVSYDIGGLCHVTGHFTRRGHLEFFYRWCGHHGGYCCVCRVQNGRGRAKTIDIDEVINDFRVLRSAFIQYKKEDKGLCEDLKTLIPYMKENRDILWDRYSISIDQKYMIVKDAKKVDAEQILKRIGGASFVKGNKLFLSF